MVKKQVVLLQFLQKAVFCLHKEVLEWTCHAYTGFAEYKYIKYLKCKMVD